MDMGMSKTTAKRRREGSALVIQTSMTLPAHLYRAIKIRCLDERIELRTLVRRALEAYLETRIPER
jgi:hypothetical protein